MCIIILSVRYVRACRVNEMRSLHLHDSLLHVHCLFYPIMYAQRIAQTLPSIEERIRLKNSSSSSRQFRNLLFLKCGVKISRT